MDAVVTNRLDSEGKQPGVKGTVWSFGPLGGSQFVLCERTELCERLHIS